MKLIQITAILGLILLSTPLIAQSEKPSCSPKACGPEGTKTSEANAIKNLRTSFEEIATILTKSKHNFSDDIKALTFKAQPTEEETLMVLNQASQIIRNEIIREIPSPQLIDELKQYKPKIAGSKQDIVFNLNAELKLYQAQVATLN